MSIAANVYLILSARKPDVSFCDLRKAGVKTQALPGTSHNLYDCVQISLRRFLENTQKHKNILDMSNANIFAKFWLAETI